MIALLASALGLALGATSIAPVAEPPAPQLAYQLVVTNPGTRSQGWRGILYDESGAPLEVAPGEHVTTPLGSFVSVECVHLWDACGLIREDMAAWMETGPVFNKIDGTAWVFSVWREAGVGSAFAWRGELTGDGVAYPPEKAPADTPMGDFVIAGGPVGGLAWTGWVHESWTSAAAPALEGDWRFIEVAGTPVPPAVEATIAFAPGGLVSGRSGCNSFTGSYVQTGAGLSFSGLGSTKMMCEPELMAVELAVQQALAETHSASMADAELVFTNAAGRVMARLTKAAP